MPVQVRSTVRHTHHDPGSRNPRELGQLDMHSPSESFGRRPDPYHQGEIAPQGLRPRDPVLYCRHMHGLTFGGCEGNRALGRPWRLRRRGQTQRQQQQRHALPHEFEEEVQDNRQPLLPVDGCRLIGAHRCELAEGRVLRLGQRR